jgi:hypothetical protein
MEPFGPPAPNLPLTSNVSAPNATVPRETYYADEEGVDIGYGDKRRAIRGAQVGRGRDGREATGAGEEDREVGGSDSESAGILARGAGQDTMRAVERLVELVQRREAGGLKACAERTCPELVEGVEGVEGVEVELEC